MAAEAGWLTDLVGERSRTEAVLRQHLGDAALKNVKERCALEARETAARLVRVLEDAKSEVLAWGNAGEGEDSRQRQSRVRGALGAADPRRLHAAIVACVSEVHACHARATARFSATDPRVRTLAERFTLSAAQGSAIGAAVAAPLGAWFPNLKVHAATVKSAVAGLRPGGLLGSLLEGAGRAVLSSGLAAMGVNSFARRHIGRQISGKLGASRFGGFIQALVDSLDGLRRSCAPVAEQVRARAEVALLAMHGGFLATVATSLRSTGVEVAAVSFETGRLDLQLTPAARARLGAWADQAVREIGAAWSIGDHRRVLALAESALADTAPYAERWQVQAEGVPAPLLFNHYRATAHAAAAANLAPPERVLLLSHALAGAPFWWKRTTGLPGPTDVALDVLAADSLVPLEHRQSAIHAVANLARRSEELGARLGVALPQPSDEDLELMRVVKVALHTTPLPAAAQPLEEPSARTIARVVQDLDRRASALGVARGATASALDAWLRARRWTQAKWTLALGSALTLVAAIAYGGTRALDAAGTFFTPEVPPPVAAQVAAAPEVPQERWLTEAEVAGGIVPDPTALEWCTRRRGRLLDASFRVGPTGDVVDVGLGDGDWTPREAECLAGVIRTFRFPASDVNVRLGALRMPLRAGGAATTSGNRRRRGESAGDGSSRRSPTGTQRARERPGRGEVTADEFE